MTLIAAIAIPVLALLLLAWRKVHPRQAREDRPPTYTYGAAEVHVPYDRVDMGRRILEIIDKREAARE